MIVAGAAMLWALVVPLAGPARADPPRPGDYRSTVVGFTPQTEAVAEAVTVTVIGGDALLQLTVEPGHEALVLGYDDEPYLRFRADGTVQENRSSPATYLNASRYGDAEVPDGVDGAAEPEWRTVADSGTYSWHDHRIHWMSTQPPAGVPRGSEVQDWEVPLLVDGTPAGVDGVLVLQQGVAWWPWALAAAGVAGMAWALGRRRPRVVAPVAAGVGCLLVAVVAGVEQLSFPAEAGRMWLTVVVPGVGLVAAIAAGMGPVVARRAVRQATRPEQRVRPDPADRLGLVGRVGQQLARLGRIAMPGNALGLVAAGLGAASAALRYAVFTKPVLPTDLAPWLDRGGTAVAFGLASAAAGLLIGVQGSNRRATSSSKPSSTGLVSQSPGLSSTSTNG